MDPESKFRERMVVRIYLTSISQKTKLKHLKLARSIVPTKNQLNQSRRHIFD